MKNNLVNCNSSDRLVSFLMGVRLANNLEYLEIPELDRCMLGAMGIRKKTRKELNDLNIELVEVCKLEISYNNRDLEGLREGLELLFLYPITIDQFDYMLERMDRVRDPINQLIGLARKKTNSKPLNIVLLLKDI